MTSEVIVSEPPVVIIPNTRPSVTTLLSTGWKYKGYLPVIASSVVKHYTTGPAISSWPLSTTLFTSLARHSQSQPSTQDANDPVAAVQKIRKAVEVLESFPLPKNGFAVDVDVKVPKGRGLLGVLEEADRNETGKRIVEAEWVVHNDVYDSGTSNKVVLYLHGGGYILMSKRTHRPITITVSKSLGCKVLSVNYRLAPEAVHPSALHDAVSAYLYLTEELKIPHQNIILGGDSAGGGLSMSLLLYLRDSSLPLPSGMILFSPWVDSTSSLASWKTNAATDYLALAKKTDSVDLHPIHLYLGKDNYTKNVLDPYILSALASFHKLPPSFRILIQTGSAEVLLDESSLLVKSILTTCGDGVEVTYQVLDGGIHVSMGFLQTEISRAAFEQMRLWGLETLSGVEEEVEWKGDGRLLVEKLLREEGEKREKSSGAGAGVGEKKNKKVKLVGEEKKLIYNYKAVPYPLPKLLVRDDAEAVGKEFVKMGVERVEKAWENLSEMEKEKKGKRIEMFMAKKVESEGVW